MGLRVTPASQLAFARSVDEGIENRVWEMREAEAYDRGDYLPGGGDVESELPGMIKVGYRSPTKVADPGAKLLSMLGELRDSSALNSPSRLKEIHGALYDFNRAQIGGMSPEVTSLKIALTYQDVYKKDPSAVWFGLATYAVGKVGEGYKLFNNASVFDPADASIARQGFYEGNQAIYNSMVTSEMVYQAGGAQAVRAMQVEGIKFGGDINGDSAKFEFSLSDSFDLRDQAKVALSRGDTASANDLLSRSLEASADFEQRIVIQQYYNKSYTADGFFGVAAWSATKTLGNASNSVAPDGWYQYGWVSNLAQKAATALSTVTVLGQSVSFTGKSVANVDERKPFVYDTAKAFLSQATPTGLINGLIAQQRIYQDQTQMIERVWGTTATMLDPLRR